jgi:hypothetical protein
MMLCVARLITADNPALLPVKQKWESTGLDMTHLLTYAAREPSLSLAFNYASLLLNNSFFLEGLNAGEPVEVPDYFRHLEQKVEAYADGIVGSAWLWVSRCASRGTFWMFTHNHHSLSAQATTLPTSTSFRLSLPAPFS